jgi:hypothetical protein
MMPRFSERFRCQKNPNSRRQQRKSLLRAAGVAVQAEAMTRTDGAGAGGEARTSTVADVLCVTRWWRSSVAGIRGDADRRGRTADANANRMRAFHQSLSDSGFVGLRNVTTNIAGLNPP